MTRTRIGLALGWGVARVVILRGHRVLEARECARPPERPLRDIVSELLGEAATTRRSSLGVVVGLADSRVKRLTALPPVEDVEALADIVREARDSFFLGDPETLVTTGVVPDSPTSAWAAALSASTVTQVQHAARALGLRLVAIAPVAAGFLLHRQTSQLRWVDGPLALEIGKDDRGVSVRCLRHDQGESEPAIEVPPALAHVGPDASRFVDAYVAARLTGAEALAVGPDGRPFRPSRRARRRLVAPVALMCAAIAALLLSPLKFELDRARVQSTIETLENSTHLSVANQAHEQLARATMILAEVDAYRRERVLRSPVLGELARALPSSAAMQSLELDDETATVVLFTSEGPLPLLASLRGSPRFPMVEVVDAPRSTLPDRQSLEGVTLRIGLGRPQPARNP